MLQPGTLTNEGDIALDNYRTAMDGISHIRRTLEETFGGLHGTHVEPDVLMDCKAICDAIYAAYRGSAHGVPDEIECVATTLEHIGNFADAAIIRQLAANQQQNAPQNIPEIIPGWIPVSERMPEREYVLAADFSGKHYSPCQPNTQVGIYADWFDDGNPTWDDGDGNDLHLKRVTHWMPLPAAPQEVNHG
ncbi:TPA: DUF551 domain-containing protein [Klebsiella pneumoniae]|nr:DUF551 domain-containing protein [Klebsiella pneumoniae]HDZ1444597.1 DUF551 domain-containing protein [Klebsiella pneumoniae]